MKTEDCSNTKNDNSQPESSEKLMGRRELLNKAGMYALSTATMMVIMKSQAKATNSPGPASNITATPPSGQNQTWQRTTKGTRQ